MGTKSLSVFNPPTSSLKMRRPALACGPQHEPDELMILPRYLRNPDEGIAVFRPGNELGEAELVATVYTSEADAIRFSANEAMYDALMGLKPQVEEWDRRCAAWKAKDDARGNPQRFSFTITGSQVHAIQKALLMADGMTKCWHCNRQEKATR